MRHLRFLVAAGLLLAAGAVFADEMSVTVKQTQVRDKASFLGKVLGLLNYADRVAVLDQSVKGWVKVQGPDGRLQGWVSASALQSKKIVLAAGSQNVEQGASSGEVALAGKGFNEDVEKQYKTQGKLDYTWVDKMETYNPSSDQVAAFLQKGGLNTAGGAQ
ncbi:MAG TPA: SH3 domain-containing protein [Spirochaetia bacterium]|nr:SH3 domain-containing protein [Spirochaetia bacterium]